MPGPFLLSLEGEVGGLPPGEGEYPAQQDTDPLISVENRRFS